jgi:hypothetical protein
MTLRVSSTDEELEAYPQVNFTSNMPWEPQVFDNEYGVDDLDLSEDDLANAGYHPSLNDCGEINQNDNDDSELFTMCTAVAKVCGSKDIVGTKQHDPNVWLRISPLFQKSKPRKASIMQPSLLVWLCGYPCVSTLKVASRRLMSAV